MMSKVGPQLCSLIAGGIYNPQEVMPQFNGLTVEEKEILTAFLQWCHENDETFGQENCEKRFVEWCRIRGERVTCVNTPKSSPSM